MTRLPDCDIDHIRFGYCLKAEIDALDLSYREAARVTGCSPRQISFAVNGRPVSAAATFLLAELAGIDLADMLPPALAERCQRIRNLRRCQGVTPDDPRETMKETRQ